MITTRPQVYLRWLTTNGRCFQNIPTISPLFNVPMSAMFNAICFFKENDEPEHLI